MVALSLCGHGQPIDQGLKLHTLHFRAGYLRFDPGTESNFVMKCLPDSRSGVLSIGTGIFFFVQLAVLSEAVRRYLAMYSLYEEWVIFFTPYFLLSMYELSTTMLTR